MGRHGAATSSDSSTELPHETLSKWNTGISSTVTYTIHVEKPLNGSVLVTDTGTVTSGFDQGATAVERVVLPQLDPTACAGAGVAQLTGPYTLTLS